MASKMIENWWEYWGPYRTNDDLCLKLKEVFGALGVTSVFVYFNSQWKPCRDHGHGYGHLCCLNCGGDYTAHGASSDIPLSKGGKHHLVCKRLRRPSDNIMPTPKYL